MPSADTFKQQAKYTTQTVKVNYLDGMQIYKSNFYRLPVTVNNAGKSAKTNYYISIKIKHFDLYLKYKSNYNFSDLRVYDTDGVTELEFSVQNQLSTNTLIFVKIPSLPASSKTIYLEYGNCGLNNKSLDLDKTKKSNTFWNFNRNAFKDWFIAQNTTRAELPHFRAAKFVDPVDGLKIGGPNFANPNGSYVNTLPSANIDSGILEPLAGQNWTNFQQRFNSAHKTNFQNAEQPIIRCNEWDPTLTINTLDTVHYSNFFANRSNALYTNSLILTPYDEYRNFYFFTVVRFEQVGISDQYFFGQHALGGKTVCLRSDNRIAIVAEGNSYICNHTSVLSAGIDYIIEARLAWTGGNNYTAAIRINGNEQTFSGSNGAMSQNFRWSTLGNASSGSNSLRAVLGEFGYCNGFNTNSTGDVAFRADIYEYLNTKYKIVGASDFPSITLGTETALNPVIDEGYESFSTFAEINHSTKLTEEFYGFGKTDTKVSFNRNLQKIWLAGNETFTGSTLNSSGNFLSTKFSQSYNATTTSNYTTCNFEKVLGGINVTKLSEFETKDILTGLKYAVNPEDYLLLELYTTSTNINLAESRLEFSDTNTFANRRFIDLQNNYFLQGLNNLKFQFSEFEELGTLSWANAKFFRLRIRLNSGSTTIYFGRGQILKNYEKLIKQNAKLIIGDAVSQDEFATSYNAVKNIVSASNILTSEDNVEIQTRGILEEFYSRKFEDLPGFPTDGRPLFIGKEASFFPAETTHFKNFVLKQLFMLAFPLAMLDFDDIDTDIQGFFDLVPYYVFRPEENVGDRIMQMLEPTFSSIYFDNSTGKIVFKSGKGLVEGAPTKFLTQDEILDYKTNTLSDVTKLNKIEVQKYQLYDSRNAFFGGRMYISTLFGFGGKFDEIGANQTKEFFFNFADGRSSDIQFLEFLRIDGFGFATTRDPASPGLNNSGMLIRSVRFLPPSTVVFTVQNQNSSSRYFYALNLQSAYTEWTKETNIPTFSNSASIAANGEEAITSELKVRTVSDFPTNLQTFWQKIVDRFGENQQKYEVEINARKDLEFVKNTGLVDKKSVLTQGNIIATSENQANKITVELVASNIRPSSTSNGNYILQESGDLILLENGTGALIQES